MKKKTFTALYITILLTMTFLLQGCQTTPNTNTNATIETPATEMTRPSPTETTVAKETEPKETESKEQKTNLPETQENAPTTNESASTETNSTDSASPENASPAAPKPENVTTQTSGALHVEGTQLKDSSGNAVQLKGISTHGLAWFPDYINEECFRQLHQEWGVNVIRLAMYTAEYGGYCSGGSQSELKSLVKRGVEIATAENMYVIIDWHILSDNNPNTHIEDAKAFFAEMSSEYENYNNVLYEICNEPNGGTGWKDIKSYAKEVISVIRSNDKDGIILVGTPNWSQYVDQAAADPITEYNNILYTLHFYAATHTDSLRNTMTAAIGSGLPVFVSEYGICDASGNGAIDVNQANQWVNVMNQYGVSYIAWNLSNKNETSAILNSSCTKTSGFTWNDLSASGQWLYQMLTGDSKPSAPENTSDNPNPSAPENASDNTGVTLTNNGIAITSVLKNSWVSEGVYFYQFDLTLENVSGSDCKDWAIDVTFNHTITLSDGWNGDYTVNGKSLHIVSKDYNGNIPAGGNVKDIGFIVSSENDLKITQSNTQQQATGHQN